MIKIAICDDEEFFREQIKEILNCYITKMNLNLSIDVFSDANKLINTFIEEKDRYNIIFLDIFIGKNNGAEIAEKIKQIDGNCQIIFVTSTSDYLLKGYDIGILNYLIKPVDRNKVEEQLDKALKILGEKKENIFTVNKKASTIFLNIKDIMYFEAHNRVITVTSENDVIDFYDKMEIIEHKMEKYHFIRCHRGYLVNCNYIKSIEKRDIILKNNAKIPISRLRVEKVKQDFFDYIKLNNV